MDSQDNQNQAFLFSYLAGIMDGEGTIRISYSFTEKLRKRTKIANPQYFASLSCGMTNKQVISLLHSTFGGGMYEERESVPNRKPIYRWVITGNRKVPPILASLLPYLVVKKEQAQTVLSFCNDGKWRKKALVSERIRQCFKCNKLKKIQGYDLCASCYSKSWRNKEIEKFYAHKHNFKTSIEELQRREQLYLKVRKLNAVGAGAETNRKDSRNAEVIVQTHK